MNFIGLDRIRFLPRLDVVILESIPQLPGEQDELAEERAALGPKLAAHVAGNWLPFDEAQVAEIGHLLHVLGGQLLRGAPVEDAAEEARGWRWGFGAGTYFLQVGILGLDELLRGGILIDFIFDIVHEVAAANINFANRVLLIEVFLEVVFLEHLPQNLRPRVGHLQGQ